MELPKSIKFLLDIFFPQFCLGCKKEGELICQDCLNTIEILEYYFCPFCKKPKRVFEQGKCLKHQRMNLNGLFSAASYRNKLVRVLIRKFKYEPFLRTLAEPLSFLIIAHFLLSENKLINQEPENSFFIPAPISSSRKRWRNFNQSEEIAKALSSFFKIPLLSKNLIKIKKTQPQVDLSLEEREMNIKNVFELKNPEQIQGKRIFLVDDVFTSGATMEECARILKQGGAKQVWGIVIAREPLNN